MRGAYAGGLFGFSPPARGAALDNLPVRLHDHREERARLSACGDHAVAAAGIVHEKVACLELFDMILVGEAHAAGDDVVELLALMVGKVDGRVLLFLEVRRVTRNGVGPACS